MIALTNLTSYDVGVWNYHPPVSVDVLEPGATIYFDRWPPSVVLKRVPHHEIGGRVLVIQHDLDDPDRQRFIREITIPARVARYPRRHPWRHPRSA